MDVRELRTDSERRRAVPLLRQLWTEQSPAEVLAWTGEAEYHLFGGFVRESVDDTDGASDDSREEQLVAVAGAFVTDVLHHERHAWLYDLVVDEPRRGQGHGQAMVEYVESWAAENDCEFLALASPLSKEAVHEFYEGQGYETWGYVIEKEL